MRKIDKYGNFFILCSCEAKDSQLRGMDGTEFRYLSDAVEFLLARKKQISKPENYVSIMVWREVFTDNGTHSCNDPIDEITLSDILSSAVNE